jgi:hypothetical protein
MASIPGSAAAHRPISVRLTLFAFVLLGIGLAFRLKGFLLDGLEAIANPYELDYGEGIVWQQMLMMFDGRGYAPIDGFPSIVFHYPPVYHAAAHGAALLGLDPLMAGRTVSFLSTLVAALLIGGITFDLSHPDARRVRLISAGTAAILALSWFPVLNWAPLMRVDMLACALSLGGFLLALRALDRPWLIFPAAIAFVAAVYTKQTMIAAPAATFGTLLVLRPRLALKGIAAAMVVGLAALALLAAATDGRFIRHVFLYNVNRFEASGLLQVAESLLLHSIYIVMAGVGVWTLASDVRTSGASGGGLRGFARRIAGDGGAGAKLMVLAYLTVATPMLLMNGKVGANINYQIEWMFVLSIFAGISVAPAARALFEGRDAPARSLLHSWAVPAALAFQSLVLLQSPYRGGPSPELAASMERLGERIRSADRPIIADNMVLLLKNGHEVVWEPAIFAELASTGVYDERPFVRKIKRRDFAFFLTFGDRGTARFHERYNPAVADAIDVAYPVKERFGKLTLHSPRP